jgi:transcriptional regulator with XRE-family HTH domain
LEVAVMDLPWLRNLRRRAVLSQEDLASRSGVARDTISKLETGQRRAYPSTIRMLLGGVEYIETEGAEDSPEKPEGEKDRKIGF